MKMSLKVCMLAIVGMLSMTAAQDYNDWYQSVNVQNAQSLEFNCSNFPIHPNPDAGGENTTLMTVGSWMLPDLTIIAAPDYDDGKVEITNGGWTLRVHSVNVSDFGIYHCMMNRPVSGEWYLVKWGINIRGPYFEDLWKKYDTNVIIGLSAAGGFLILSACVYLVWTYRWQEPEVDDSPYNGRVINAYGTESYDMSSTKPGVTSAGQGYSNAAFTNDHNRISTPPPDYDSGDSDLRQRKVAEETPAVVHAEDESKVTHVAEANYGDISDTRM